MTATTHPAAIPICLRKIARTALFTAAIAFGTTALGQAAIATAEPVDRDWYNQCVGRDQSDDPNEDINVIEGSCCIRAGGVPVTNDDGTFGYCANPPSAPAGATLPGEQLNPNLPQPTCETLPPGPVPLPVQPVG